jgi:hypothetical protein
MNFTRGTTPTIEITVKNEIDFSQVAQIWVYISQMNKIKVDKEITDVTFDQQNNKITLTLSQEDTLALKPGDALFQIRLLLQNTTALATLATKITINEVYKGGVIGE